MKPALYWKTMSAILTTLGVVISCLNLFGVIRGGVETGLWLAVAGWAASCRATELDP